MDKEISDGENLSTFVKFCATSDNFDRDHKWVILI